MMLENVCLRKRGNDGRRRDAGDAQDDKLAIDECRWE